MHRFFVPEKYQEYMKIDGVNGRHITRVLRMVPGEKLQLVSDDGVAVEAEIYSLNGDEVTVKCLKVIAESHEPSTRVFLAQGLVKGEKMDFIIQKAVELGVAGIIPVAMEHSVVRLDREKAEKKVARWQKIAEAAAKQSKRDLVPQVFPLQNMEELLAAHGNAVKLIAYECELHQGLKSVLHRLKDNGLGEILLIIGPEGGISEAELTAAVNCGAEPVSLGRRILRAETAGIVAISAIFYETGDLGD